MSVVNSREAAFTFAAASDWSRAVDEARRALAADPEDAGTQALLALGLAHQKEGPAAVEAGRRAVALDPELAFAHYALGWALYEHDEIAEAEGAARDALRLDPDADNYSLLGQVLLRRRRWQDALTAAEDGLRLDADHGGCSHVRSLALSSLGRREEADHVARAALARDPEDPAGHARHGWLLLRDRRYDEALDSFRTALRLDPGSDAARAGIVEALKARHGVYRLLLRYTLWLGTLSAGARWGIIIGLFVMARVGRALLRENPTWWPVLAPLLVGYFLFVLTTWLAEPVSNLLLRLNRFGRLVLSPAEVTASNLVGGCLVVTLVGVLLFAATEARPWLFVALVSGLMLIPIGAAFGGHGTRAWRPLLAVLVLLAALGAAAVVVSLFDVDAAALLLVAMLVGVFAYGWIANFLVMKYS